MRTRHFHGKDAFSTKKKEEASEESESSESSEFDSDTTDLVRLLSSAGDDSDSDNSTNTTDDPKNRGIDLRFDAEWGDTHLQNQRWLRIELDR